MKFSKSERNFENKSLVSYCRKKGIFCKERVDRKLVGIHVNIGKKNVLYFCLLRNEVIESDVPGIKGNRNQ